MPKTNKVCVAILCAAAVAINMIGYKDAFAVRTGQAARGNHLNRNHRVQQSPLRGNHRVQQSTPGGNHRAQQSTPRRNHQVTPHAQNNVGGRVTAKPVTNQEIILPSDLKLTNGNITFHHFRANQQEGVTCGNHAVFNAVAIQELVEEGKSLDSKSVATRAAQFYPNMQASNVMLTYADVIHLGINLQLKNAHVFAYNSEKDQYYTAGEIRAPKEVDAFFDQIRNASKISAHFIFYTPGHWTTVSVVKKDGKYQVIHLNSTNAKVKKNGQIYNFLQEIHARLS